MWPEQWQGAPSPKIGGLRDAPEHWPSELSLRSAVVLALFIPGKTPEAPLELLFTKRSNKVRTHKGQVGFPGGRREARDLSPIATALREAHEEIGLNPARVKILGALPQVKSLELDPVLTMVGCAELTLEELEPNTDEVAEIFTVPWTCFLAQEKRPLKFNIFGLWRDTFVYPAQGAQVWGLTAKIISLADLQHSSST